MMTDDYIYDNDLTDLSVIYFTGAWVEGMNIGTHTMLGNDDHKISVLLSDSNNKLLWSNEITSCEAA